MSRRDAEIEEQRRFPALRLCGGMAAVGAIALTLVCLIGPRFTSDAPVAWLHAATWAFALVWLAYVVTVAGIAVAAPRGLTPLAWAFFGAMILRMGACLGIAGIGVRMAWFPAQPMAVSLAAVYLPMLVLEVLALHRYLRVAEPQTTGPGTPAPSNSPHEGQGAISS